SSRRRHTRFSRDWSSDVCSSDLRDLLAQAKEEDLYLSTISPLGIPFNTIKGTSNERLKSERIAKGRPGSSCPRKYLALDKTYDTEGTCTASRKHQELSLAILEKRKNA